MMRRLAKRDASERDIIVALRAVGASVSALNEAGVPDLLVGHQGRTYLLEVKMPSRLDGKAHTRTSQGGEGEFTASQIKWWSVWRGSPAVIVHNADEALAAIGAAEAD
jgi:hypothetical protein